MNSKTQISQILFVGFFVRIFVYILGKYIALPHSDGDALVIEVKSYTFSYISNLDYSLIFSQGSEFLPYLLSFIYAIFGREEIILNFIMISLGTLLIKYIYDASLLIWEDNKLAIKVAWITVFFPQFCLHSVLLLREIPTNLCLIIAIISFIKYLKYTNKFYLLKFVFFTVLGMLFHSAIVFVFVGVAIYFIQKKGNLFNKIIIPSLLILILITINSQGIGLGKFGGSLDNSMQEFYVKESRLTKGGSSYPNWMRINQSLSDIWKVPIRYVTFLFAPLIPFLVKSFSHIIGLIDSFFYVYVFRQFYIHRKVLKLKKEYKLILTVSLVLALIFSLGVTNVGTAIRHRTKFAPLLLIIMFEKRNLRTILNSRKK